MHEVYRKTIRYITLIEHILFHLYIFLKYELLITYQDISDMINHSFCLNTFIPQFV